MMKQALSISIILLSLLLPLAGMENDPVMLEEKLNSDVNTQTEPELMLSGLLRNDAVLSTQNSKAHFSDIIEGRLVMNYNADAWKLYADGRIYAFFGEAIKNEGRYRASLMRAFIRYFSPAGDFTLGKTYVNFGHPGLFNPFESNKQVILTDISYDKEGLLALEYCLDIGEKSGFKLYAGNDIEEDSSGIKSTYRGGGSIWTNALRFDMGLVANHLDRDRNTTGVYFKGDVLVGLQGAYAVHFTDNFASANHEVIAGADYSFYSGKIVINVLFYFYSAGSSIRGVYEYLPDSYFAARYYTHGKIKYIHDEFFSTGVYALTNCIDSSTVIVPSFSVVLANGLTLTLLFSTVTGNDSNEFSGDTSGWFSTVIRIEGKF